MHTKYTLLIKAESLSHRMASDLERGYISEPKQALKPFVSANAEKNLKELLVNHLIIRWLYDRLDHEQQNSKDKGTEERILAGERGLHQIIENLRANAVVINSERWYPEQWDLVKETHVFGPHPSDHFMKICLRGTFITFKYFKVRIYIFELLFAPVRAFLLIIP